MRTRNGAKWWMRGRNCGWIRTTWAVWTAEFTALTTNNTLLNNKIQKGIYDELVKTAANELRREFVSFLPEWSEQDMENVTRDGKIPLLSAWAPRLASGEIGLDDS